VVAHCRLLIEQAGSACVAVKPQLACFERLGAPGWAPEDPGVTAENLRSAVWDVSTA
jgi:orotidine-5'-phosphate decarboxylase